MRKVKFLQDYEDYKKGDIVKLDRETARYLEAKSIVTYYFMRKESDY